VEGFTWALDKTMEGDYFDMAIVSALWGSPNLTDRFPVFLTPES
jgi:hypothetical protein